MCHTARDSATPAPHRCHADGGKGLFFEVPFLFKIEKEDTYGVVFYTSWYCSLENLMLFSQKIETDTSQTN